MFRRSASAAVMLVIVATAPASAAGTTHACAGDAVAQARKLLRFHVEGAAGSNPINDGASVKVLPQVRALKGAGTFDVLEVTSDIYKASYRMRFIYARSKGPCLLMGQEILEASNPY